MSAPQVVLSRMQLTLSCDSPNTPRRFRAWCTRCLPARSKPNALRAGVAGMLGSLSEEYGYA